MSKVQIIGLIVLLAGIATYFFVEGEPYTTIAGLIGGIGLGVILFGQKIIAGFKK